MMMRSVKSKDEMSSVYSKKSYSNTVDDFVNPISQFESVLDDKPDIPYWKKAFSELRKVDDVVIIHVCDENRHVTKDFCCKRDILVTHMKYFESFLSESDTGYDDIDISVHCDVEIFEWLMAYIHDPDNPPQLDKALVVSILISSDFLQMDTLVELCLDKIAANLSDIIKLPIDLSCISEKLINRLAALTHPTILANTRDRKDKILNKLYKRRVELDFSRKSGGSKLTRSLASSLTCCQCCATVYLDSCVSSLVCRHASVAVDYRGRLVKRHRASPDWSLTSYLKALHGQGMNWESIYWHVWGACVVFRVQDYMFCAAEVDRYIIEPDGLLVNILAKGESGKHSQAPTPTLPSFCLDIEDDLMESYCGVPLEIKISDWSNEVIVASTPTLHPLRPNEVLTKDIYDLLVTQQRLISSEGQRHIIETISSASVMGSAPVDELPVRCDLFAEFLDGIIERDLFGALEGDDEKTRGRSPTRQGVNKEKRQAHSTGAKVRDTGRRSDKRSRSSSGAPRQLLRSNSLKNSMMKAKTAVAGGSLQESMSPSIQTKDEDLLPILLTLPAEVQSCISPRRGPLYGVWHTPHPLTYLGSSHEDVLDAIQSTSMSDAKRIEWELDALREHDEKRMERYEDFLLSCRKNPELQIKNCTSRLKDTGVTKKKDDDKNIKIEYYKDKGRQPKYH